MCIEYIYRHIRKLPRTQIFTTREMLIYGTRSAVDAALHRMVKSEFIVRLARGVFVRDDSLKPSILEIAEAKAKVFKIAIAKHAETLLHEFKISHPPVEAKFAKIGYSSSFWTVRGRVHFIGVCAKKMYLTDSKVGRVIYALWYWGQRRCLSSDVRLATDDFRCNEREELWLLGALMPAWLNQMCRHRFHQPRVVLANVCI